MSSIAKANISLSKKDLSKSRIPPVASRNVMFYHKAPLGSLTINLLSLIMPSAEMPTATQATNPEISGAQLMINKKNLELTSSSNGKLIQDLDYIVIDSYTISLIGPYIGVGAEVDEIFVGTINSAPISDLVVASAKSVDKTYELAVGSTTLNLGREYKVGVNPFENVGIIKVFVNGVLALRDIDYTEIDSGNGYGSTLGFYAAPVSIPYSVVVDFGVMAITDNNAIGVIESLGGAIKKIADDLAVVAGTTASDYYSASPSEVERRAFGDMVLVHEKMLDISIPAFIPWTASPAGSSWTTNTTTALLWRRVGEEMEVRFSVTLSGAPNNTFLDINIPNSAVIDSTKMSAAALADVNATVQANDSGSGKIFNAYLNTNTTIRISYMISATGGATAVGDSAENNVTGIVPVSWGAGDVINGTFKVPIVGWDATQTIRQLLGL